MPNNLWKITGHQLLTESPDKFKDNTNLLYKPTQPSNNLETNRPSVDGAGAGTGSKFEVTGGGEESSCEGGGICSFTGVLGGGGMAVVLPGKMLQRLVQLVLRKPI
jgi:hypothetical protein